MKQWFFGIAAMGLLSFAWAAADGAALYQQSCSGCHGKEAQGVPGAFPPLANNPRVGDEALVLRVIKEGLSGPLEVNGQQFNGIMPPMAYLSETDAKAIAAYLKTLAKAPAPVKPAPEAPLAAAPTDQAKEAALGRALFGGQARFQNGGAPCVACHTAGSLGALGGGSLGKNLTDLHTRLGSAGIQAVLDNPAFLVMREAYKGKTFTPEEKAALTAFFERTAQEATHPASTYAGRVWFVGVVGVLVLFGLMGLLWNNRRESLAERIRGRRV